MVRNEARKQVLSPRLFPTDAGTLWNERGMPSRRRLR